MRRYILTEKELIFLLERKNELEYLEMAGVDNWQGYGEHYQLLEDDGYSNFEEAAISDLVYYMKEE